MNNMSLSKIMRFNCLMEKVLAKQLKSDEAQEYFALMKQWNDPFKGKQVKS
jgi:hypothetical protein